VARLSTRSGYRPPELVLGAVRPILSYPGFDTLAEQLLGVVAEGGAAHEEWLNVLRAAALELADDAVKVDPADSTLRVALGLLLKVDPKLAGNTPATPVLKRDSQGNALTTDTSGDLPTPFLVVNRADDAERGDNTLAQSGGAPLYETFDASQTMLAATMREASRLIARGDEERSGLENIAHGIKPLLGPWGAQAKKIGQNDFAYQGPKVDESPMLEFVHALAALARYPETEVIIEVLRKIVAEKESAATGFDYSLLALDRIADEFPNAKLNGPHELWDDLIVAGDRILKRPGMAEGLIRSFTKPEAALQGKLFANWMTYKDQVTYANAPITPSGEGGKYTEQQKTDINTVVEHMYAEKVDRSAPDVGPNRSVWQRTMSLINSLNGVPVCNKKGAILNVPTGIGLFTFPLLDPAGYPECGLIEFKDAVEVYSLSLLGKAKVVLKDDIALALAELGGGLTIVGTVAEITETESQLTGFKDTISAESTARFIFAPPNKFISDLFDPLKTVDGVPIREHEPYGLFPMEVKDPEAGNESFIKLGVPLVQAFDEFEPRDAEGKLPDGYMFGNLLSVFHKHWASRKTEPCAATVEPGKEGCTQSLAPGAFYSPQTGAVSYEELIAKAFKEEDVIEILHRATVALAEIKVMNKDGVEIDGIKALSDFVTVLMTPDPTLANRAGKLSTKTNLCVEVGGACQNDVGRIIPNYTPLYLLLDSIKQIDNTWEKPENTERHEVWLKGRGKLVDQLLDVTRSGAAGAYDYKLTDRTAYEIFLAALPWATEQIAKHRTKGDLAEWLNGPNGLATRLGTILSHPITAATIDLLDKFWTEPEASGEFIKIAASLLDEQENPAAFRGMLVAAADTITLLDTDQELSPAIQFASLAIAPNAFEALDSQALPEVTQGTLFAGAELARAVIVKLRAEQPDASAPTTLSKMLRNLVLSDGNARSPAEELIDIVADVNRIDTDQPTEVPLTAMEDRKVFGDVKGFLYDGADGEEKKSLERLYEVIQARSLKGQDVN